MCVSLQAPRVSCPNVTLEGQWFLLLLCIFRHSATRRRCDCVREGSDTNVQPLLRGQEWVVDRQSFER